MEEISDEILKKSTLEEVAPGVADDEEEVIQYEPGVPDPRMPWSVMGIWNDMSSIEERPAKVRDYISPSDIGKDFWGRYQKMMGVEPTNPYEPRVKRIFAAGDTVHDTVKNVFRAAGLFINSQDDAGWSVLEPTEKTLKVLGKYDVLAGGKVNVVEAIKNAELYHFSEFHKAKVKQLAESIAEKYPEGLKPMLYEIKSVNSQAFWNKKDHLKEAYPWHVLQCYAYLKANKLEEGRLLYVSKDDWVTQEHPIYLNDPELEKALQEDLEKMTYYINAKEEPPKPKSVIFNPDGKIKFQRDKKKFIIHGAFEKNWEVERSIYFQILTGFDNKKDWIGKTKEELKTKNDQIKDIFLAKSGLKARTK